MQVHVNNGDLLEDLAVYLRAAECTVEQVGESLLAVEIPRAPSPEQARRELELYLAAWRAMHADARVALID